MAKQRVWRLIALMMSCVGLTVSALACSTAPADSTAGAATYRPRHLRSDLCSA